MLGQTAGPAFHPLVWETRGGRPQQYRTNWFELHLPITPATSGRPAPDRLVSEKLGLLVPVRRWCEKCFHQGKNSGLDTSSLLDQYCMLQHWLPQLLLQIMKSLC